MEHAVSVRHSSSVGVFISSYLCVTGAGLRRILVSLGLHSINLSSMSIGLSDLLTRRSFGALGLLVPEHAEQDPTGRQQKRPNLAQNLKDSSHAMAPPAFKYCPRNGAMSCSN